MEQKYLLDTNICIHLFRGRQEVAKGMTMVTENVSHLSRIQGICLENWVVRQ